MSFKYFLLLLSTNIVFAKEEATVKVPPPPLVTGEPTEEEGTAAEIQGSKHKRRSKRRNQEQAVDGYLNSDKTVTSGSGDHCVLDDGVLALEKLFKTKAEAMDIFNRHNISPDRFRMALQGLRSTNVPITDLVFANQILFGTNATDQERIKLSTHLKDIREAELNPCFVSALKASFKITPDIKASLKDISKFKELFEDAQKKIGSSNDKVFLLKQRLFIEQYRSFIVNHLNAEGEGLSEKKKNRLLSYSEEINSLLHVIDKKVFGDDFNSLDVLNFDLNYNHRSVHEEEPEPSPPANKDFPLTT